ncbi:MAG: Dyp-type peroxidase [Alphaproteobacteria bacterium]|nr:Dyp-type peroxidase [Alphaproteobacteria bacterium]
MSRALPQPGILAALPDHGRYYAFSAVPGREPAEGLARLAARPLGPDLVVGLGPDLVRGLGASIPGLRAFPALGAKGVAVPATQADLWCWLRGKERGQLVHAGRALLGRLGGAFHPTRVVDGFKYRGGRDLTGYEDGTENPKGAAAARAAIHQGKGRGLAGSSFAAVQVWAHDLDRFETFTPGQRDAIVGRRLRDNREIADAPASAHVKRTAQENFQPPAFLLRRSMPWGDGRGEGLVFVAFGHSLDAFEAQLRRMTGQDDGVIDGLFQFSRPLTGGYFWCPPLKAGRLDLGALGL